MNPDLLSQEDLVDLTGYQLPRKQAEVLARHKINYIQRRDGKLRVTWTQVNAQGAKQSANDESGFNVDFMDNA
jgi:hypothetical protein